MSLRARLLALGVPLAAGVAAAAAWLAPQLGVSSAYPLTAGLVASAGLLVALIGIGGHYPFPRLGPANLVTLVRGGVLALVAGLVAEPATVAAAWAGVACGTAVAVLDGVDGLLARRTGMSSRFGARFDMEIDALLILVLSCLAWRHGKAGAWVLLGGLLRYAFVVAGWLLAWMRAPLSSTFRGKTVAVAHTSGVCTALGPIVPWPLSAAAAALTTALLLWSFGVDVGRLWRARADG